LTNNFVKLFLEYTKEYESPENFWRWSAYATVAAVLRTNAYFAQGMIKTFPNMYVVILADSAEYRKSAPFKLVTKLLAEVDNTKIISGHASIQGILDVLSQDTGLRGKGTRPVKGGSSILIARELASFFVEDPKLLPLLTDMYDYDPNFQYVLKGNLVEIKELCVNFLAASNTELFTGVYDTKATYGGLLRRTFIICPNERRKANSLVNYEDNIAEYNKVLHALKEVAALSGKFTMTPEAFKIYDAWYKKTYVSYAKAADRTGFIQSIHISILKVAMVLAATDLTLKIEEKHITQAMSETLSLRENYTKLVMKAGKTEPARIGGIIVEELMSAKNNVVEQWEFHARHWQDFSALEFDNTLITLVRAGFIITIQGKNGQPAYKATQKCIDTWNLNN
tara:strand:+ start:631 stop:1815 length:1185 start_codon:yes stop_codon:yes gene_type:complete